MAELNQNRNSDQDQAPDRNMKDLPLITLPNHYHNLSFVRTRTGRRDGPIQASGNMGEQCVE